MLKKCMKLCAATAMGAAAMLAVNATGAYAHSSVTDPFKHASISFVSAGAGRAGPSGHRDDGATTVRVIHDGSSYTALEGNISAVFNIKAKVKVNRRITGFTVTTGDPTNEHMLPENVMGVNNGDVNTKKLDRDVTFILDANTAIATGSWGSEPTTVQDVIDTCNAKFDELPAEDQTAGQVELTIHAGFAAGKRSRLTQAGEGWMRDSDYRPAVAHTTLPVNIVCAGNPEPRTAETPPPRAKPKAVSIDLKVDQHGERCPKDVTVTAYADYKSPAKSRMRMTVSGVRPKFRFAKTRKVTFAGKTFHRAEAQFKYKLDPGQKTFTLTVDGKKGKSHTETVEIKCPPFKVTSAWLKYEVEQTPTCPKMVTETATFHTTRPGWVNHEIRMKGGLVVSSGKLTSKREGDKYVATAVRKLTMNAIDSEFMADAVDYPANSGWVPLRVKCLDIAGDFSFVDHGSPKCPRTGKALITFKSNMPDDIGYRLDCTNGENFSGVLKPAKTPQGDYVAAKMQTFNVTQTSVYSCALKTVQPGPVKLHKWKSHTFECATAAVETGSNDFTPETPRQPDSPSTGDRVPGKVVTTVPPVIVTPVPEGPQRTGGAGTLVDGTTATICESTVCNCRNRPGWTIEHRRTFENGMPSWAYKCIPGASDDKTTNTGNADKPRIDVLKIAKEKAEAERLRRAKIAAELSAKRKRQLEAAQKARLLKLQQERERKAAAAAAQARANALRALSAKRTNNVKIAPRRRANPAPTVNRMMMLRAR